MPESETHKFLKNKLALVLEQEGYKVKTEFKTNEGRIDVFGEKGEEQISIEVFKTHIPNWLIAKVKGDLDLPNPSQENPDKKCKTFLLDTDIFENFKNYCNIHGYFMGKVIEIFMTNFVENKNG